MLGINPYVYCQWVFDNMKLRIEEKRLQYALEPVREDDIFDHESTGQWVWRPKPSDPKDPTGNTYMSMYDEKYRCWVDLIEPEYFDNLTPWAYLRMLEEESARLKRK